MQNKTVIVTGAGTGIGKATALQFARSGASLALAGRREAPLKDTASACHALGARAIIHPCDLEDGDAAAALGRWALAELKHIDVLVNNAGHSTKVRALRYVDPDEFSSVFRINVEGVYRLTQSLIESMVSRASGTVITVSSMAAVQPSLLGGVPYGAAKAASLNMMQGLCAELRNHGIRASTIIPAEVNTPILDNRPQPPDQAARAKMMQAQDVADAIFLCASLPERTLIEQIIMSPTRTRNTSAELETASSAKPPPP